MVVVPSQERTQQRQIVACYAARYVAKNIVAAGLADKCGIELAYAIGAARPLSIFADTFGTGKVSNEKLVEIVEENFDLRPGAIIKNSRPVKTNLQAGSCLWSLW